MIFSRMFVLLGTSIVVLYLGTFMVVGAVVAQFVTRLEIRLRSEGGGEIRELDTGSKESNAYRLSAEDDPDGNWGWASEGMQMSLRFSKNVVSSGEPVIATILIRNVSDKPGYYSLWGTSVEKDFNLTVVGESGAGLASLRAQSDLSIDPGKSGFKQRLSNIVNNSKAIPLPPGSQNSHLIRLDELFDLRNPGKYYVTASHSIPTLDRVGWGMTASGTAILEVQASPGRRAQPVVPAPIFEPRTTAANIAPPVFPPQRTSSPVAITHDSPGTNSGTPPPIPQGPPDALGESNDQAEVSPTAATQIRSLRLLIAATLAIGAVVWLWFRRQRPIDRD
jgi:hypothetical protein